ncbi:hypothetical protein ACN20G_19510 [Streptomyces sp. BI20]|uniref:hypothetical protein n=1 Tax=Streptomyces sp. BI20 TaxID=3403460 RepID=UPI003C758E1D
MTETPHPMRLTRAAMFAAVCVTLAAVGHVHMSGADVPPGTLLASFAVIATAAWHAAGRRRGPVGITAALLAGQGLLHLLFTTGQQAAVRAATGVSGGAGAGGPHCGHAAHAGHPHLAELPAPLPDLPADHAGVLDAAPAAVPVPVPVPVTVPVSAVDPGTLDPAAMGDPTGMAGMAGMAGMDHGGLGMLLAHLLAGLFCALWLVHGEAAVFRLAHLATRPLRRGLTLAAALLTLLVPAPARPAGPRPRTAPRPARRLRGALPAHTVIRRGPPTGPRTRAIPTPGRPVPA